MYAKVAATGQQYALEPSAGCALGIRIDLAERHRLRHLAREPVQPLVWSLRAEHRRGRFATAFQRHSVPFGNLTRRAH